MSLISQRSCGRKHEAARNNRGDEWEAEEGEWVLLEQLAVAGGEGIRQSRFERLRGEWAGHVGGEDRLRVFVQLPAIDDTHDWRLARKCGVSFNCGAYDAHLF